MTLTVLMNAGPWLPVPPPGYGGIENVIATLVPRLRERGVRVILAAAGDSTLEVDELVPTFPSGCFDSLSAPYGRVVGIAHAHMDRVMQRLHDGAGDIDLVHDHLEVVGPSVLAAAGDSVPPALQTLHWDLQKHPGFYGRFDGRGRVRFVGVSDSQVARAPASLRAQTLGAVPLAVAVEEMPFTPVKDGPFLVLGRLCADKGPDVALRLCAQGGHRVELAGPVAGLPDAEALARALSDASAGVDRREDVAYFHAAVEPWLDGDARRWIGSLVGPGKLEHLTRARAMLAPIRWDEPGGTAIVEALACGTPVIGMRRGALASLVEHGVTGFLADTEAELAAYLDRAGEIDPQACRRAAEARFSDAAMAEAYIDRYTEVIRSARALRATRGPRLPTAPLAASGAPDEPAPAAAPGPR